MHQAGVQSCGWHLGLGLFARKGVSLLIGMWGAGVSSPAFPMHFLLGSNAYHWT